ncbi:MAG: hypothetical protein ACOCSD_06035 [Halolamina sp.]
MTDTTEDAERTRDRHEVSLPLLDSFTALEAKLAAKEAWIEHLERELADTYRDESGPRRAVEGADTSDPAPSDGASREPRSHDDWVPATDPLDDTGAVEGRGDHEGVTARAVDRSASTEPPPSESDERGAAGDSSTPSETSGLRPVRTAGTDRESTNVPTGDRESQRAAAGAGSNEAAESTRTEPDPTGDRSERLSRLLRRAERRSEGEVVDAFVRGIESLDDVTRGMLAHYRAAGAAAPVDAHVAAGASGKRQYAYARNRTLRKAGVIEHEGGERYRYALPALVAEAFDGQADDETLSDAVAAIESATGLRE